MPPLSIVSKSLYIYGSTYILITKRGRMILFLWIILRAYVEKYPEFKIQKNIFMFVFLHALVSSDKKESIFQV